MVGQDASEEKRQQFAHGKEEQFDVEWHLKRMQLKCRGCMEMALYTWCMTWQAVVGQPHGSHVAGLGMMMSSTSFRTITLLSFHLSLWFSSKVYTKQNMMI
jgi:hypothetical protein